MLLIRPLAQSGVTPNTLTVIGLLLSIVTAGVITQGFLMAGGLLVLFAGIFDMFDGAMARVNNTATTFGAFFDSTLDRYSESIILLGLLFYVLQRPNLHDALWPFANEQRWMIIGIFIAVVGSLMVSYVKARAEGLGLECKTGLLARPERVVILALGLLTGLSIWAIIILAIFSQVTAIERIVYVWRTTSSTTGQTPTTNEVKHLSSDAFATAYNAKDTGTENLHTPTTVGTSEARETREPSAHPVHTAIPPFNSGVHQE
jgi:phosphatidylglycerophosphate synthase